MNKLVERIRNIGFEDGAANYQSMNELVDELRNIPTGRQFIPNMFEFFEANADKTVGTPGPFVHFIEEKSDYHELLKESVRRIPTRITIWMVNRILNVVCR